MSAETNIVEFLKWLESRCRDLDDKVDAAVGDPWRRDRAKTERAEAESILLAARRFLET